ncbi:MAG: Wzz/FepE/Etk N-terminal domain-containing protein [Rhodovibrio sp.]|nr:Wzz/FepE/Etk N-terminal domain-containing protein [Rhodovibrio sp.]
MHGNVQLLPPPKRDGVDARTGGPGQEADSNEVAQLLRTLWRQRGLICAVTLLCTAAVLAVVLRLPPTYRGEAVLLFAPTPVAADPTGARVPSEQPGDLRHLASEIERIRDVRC